MLYVCCPEVYAHVARLSSFFVLLNVLSGLSNPVHVYMVLVRLYHVFTFVKTLGH